MEYLTDWRTWMGIVGTVIFLGEIGRVIVNRIAKKERDKQATKNVFTSLADKKLGAFPFTYSGPLFIKAKNKFEANKKFNEFKKEHGMLKKRLDEKKNASKK